MNETNNSDNTPANGTNGAVNHEATKEAGKASRKDPRKEVPKKEPGKLEGVSFVPPLPNANYDVSVQAAPAQSVQPDETPHSGLRLRMKVWTDPATQKRYLMPSAVITDAHLMTAYAMSDEDTRPVKLTPLEWNALPFFYFQEDGPAPRASARPVDVLR